MLHLFINQKVNSFYSEGYIYSGSKDKSSRNDLGKMHHDLVDYASLSEEDKEKDKHIGSK